MSTVQNGGKSECERRLFHEGNVLLVRHLINTAALARCKGAVATCELFQQFRPGEKKPLKRLMIPRSRSHRAKAAVLMRCLGNKAGCLALLVGLVLFPSLGLAHRLDEYLQATLVTIEPGEVRLQINLTPGVEVADKVLALVDRNHDGVLSTNEAAAYCELLKRELTVYLDGRKISLELTASNFPALSELRTGWGFMQVEFSAPVGPLAPGPHQLEFKNRHLPRLSVYLFNAAQPNSSLVQITRQKRNKNQSLGEIEFTIQPPRKDT
jgi:hypothetical protein